MAARSPAQQRQAVVDAARTVLDEERDIQAAEALADQVIAGVMNLETHQAPAPPASRLTRWVNALIRD